MIARMPVQRAVTAWERRANLQLLVLLIFPFINSIGGVPFANVGYGAFLNGSGLEGAVSEEAVASASFYVSQTPTPEPATWMLVGSALVGLGLVKKNTRQWHVRETGRGSGSV